MKCKAAYIIWSAFTLISPVCTTLRSSSAESDVILTIERPQAAGIAAFRAYWDTPVRVDENGATEVKDSKIKDKGATAVWSPEKRKSGKPGALAFDALHRSILVRFPDAAEKIAAQVQKGYAIRKVELVLPFKDTELWPVGETSFPSPDGYLYRMNWGVEDYWKHTPPRWHAVAWMLRKPWMASDKLGPTYNASINGIGYWAKYGAQDETNDRHKQRFGPTEVSYKETEGRMDVTATLSDTEFGAALKDRLRSLADHGFLIKKWETYDHHYYHDVYEWSTSTGGRAIFIRAPKLDVTFTPAEKPEAIDNLAAPVNVMAVAGKLRQNKSGGRPTAVLPNKQQLNKWAAEAAAKPVWMADWQWKNVRQLASLSSSQDVPKGHRSSAKTAKPFWYQFVRDDMIRYRVGAQLYDKANRKWVRVSTPEEVYAAWVDTILSRQPRGWYGFEAAGEMTQWYVFNHTLPGPARDHFRAVWEAWLMPDRSTKELEHPMADKLARKPVTDKDFVDSYVARTGDWRGDKSFYRDGFCYAMSTQNFNTTASTGALLGGAVIDSKHAMSDGRHGVETLLLPHWAWGDGSSQENIDPYYFPVTLTGQKTIADFGPTRLDRLMGESMLTKSLEEVLSSYHPNLRRFVAASNRTSLEYLLVTQDGLQFILHTLTLDGALHDLDNSHIPGNMPVLGREVTPERIAQQALISPWAPEWVVHKPLPYAETNTRSGGGWQCGYQGQHYGLASVSQGWPRIQVMAQWRRESKPIEKMEDLVTMNVRYGLNRTEFVNTVPGFIEAMGQQAVFQHKNKMLVVANPSTTDWLKKKVAKEGLQSLQSSLALFNYQSSPTWEIYVEGDKITTLPYKVKQGQRITIKDGVSYLGVIPLPATDLGRTDEVVLHPGKEQTYQNMKYRAALVIDSFNLKRPFAEKAPRVAELQKLEKSFGGFVVELSDATEYDNFTAFQQHMRKVKLETKWDASKTRVRVQYSSGKDKLEGIFQATASLRTLTDCKINGQPAYLSRGLLRDTTLAQQGKNGELRKNGAVLKTDPGVTVYLRTDPSTGTYMALNAMPTPTSWFFSVPGDVTVRADGRMGLAKVIVRPKENKIWIDYARKQDQNDLAKSLLVGGLTSEPKVIRNGQAVRDKLATKTLDNKTVYIIPLP